MQDSLDARQVNFRILGERMVTLHQECPHCQQEKPEKVQRLVFVRKNFVHLIVAAATCVGMVVSLTFRSATHEATA